MYSEVVPAPGLGSDHPDRKFWQRLYSKGLLPRIDFYMYPGAYTGGVKRVPSRTPWKENGWREV
jgi:hypothetical protein